MWRRLSNKRKYQWCCGLILLLALAGYFRAVRGTIDLISDTRTLRQEVTDKDDLERELEVLKNESARLIAQLGDTDVDIDQVKQELLKETIDYCDAHSLEIHQLPESHGHTENNYKIVTNSFVVSGGFIDLIQLNDHYEQTLDISMIASVKYYVEKDKRTRKNRLYARFILQNISTI